MTQEAIQITETPPLPGVKLVQDMNKALLTVATDFAGPDDPAAKAGPYMTWADTTTLTLKRRNAANSSWVIEGKLLSNSGAASGIDYDNTESGLSAGNAQAAIDELDASIGFAIIYPNGGTQEMPANVSVNTVYITASPFPGHHVICEAEVLYAGKWGDTGWAYRAGGIGVRASEYDGEIAVITGEVGLLYGRNTTGTSHNTAAANYVTPLPCRVLVWKLKGAI